MDSIPRDHASYARLGLIWSEKLARAGQTEAATGLLRQVQQSHPDRRDAARRLRALEGERFGPLVLGAERRGPLVQALWLDEVAHGWAELSSSKDAAETLARARWQADLTLPGLAPVLTHGEGPDGRAFVLLSVSGAPTTVGRRGLGEALRLTRDAVTVLRGLAALGVELPDGELARFWGDGRKHPLTLVDLRGATKTDPARAGMGLAGPARDLARALLWDERLEGLRGDLPEDVARVLGGRAPVTVLARALVIACAR